MRKRPFLLISNAYKDRHGYAEVEPHVSERARRRGIVAGFLASKSYWSLMHWLRHQSGARGLFLTLDEAARYFRAAIAVGTGANRSEKVDDHLRARYVAARYFSRHLHARGRDGRPLMGREWL